MAYMFSWLVVMAQLISMTAGDQMYIIGDAISEGVSGFVAPFTSTVVCAGNASQAMASYLAGPNTTLVQVDVSMCGQYLLSDVLNGLQWVQSDMATKTGRVTIALAIPVQSNLAGINLIDSTLEWFVAKRAVVATLQDVWNSTLPQGVLTMPYTAASPGVPPSVSPPPVAPPDAPATPEVPSPPATGRGDCNNWIYGTIAATVAFVLVSVVLCAVVCGICCARRDRATREYDEESQRSYPKTDTRRVSRRPYSKSAGAQRAPAPSRPSRGTKSLEVSRKNPDVEAWLYEVPDMQERQRRLLAAVPLDEDRSVHLDSAQMSRSSIAGSVQLSAAAAARAEALQILTNAPVTRSRSRSC